MGKYKGSDAMAGFDQDVTSDHSRTKWHCEMPGKFVLKMKWAALLYIQRKDFIL